MYSIKNNLGTEHIFTEKRGGGGTSINTNFGNGSVSTEKGRV